MPEPEDHQLLTAFARTESEPAFAALVGRYVNLVYSTALRSTGNPHHAEEITQAVFIILARKAGKLSPRVVLSGWLYQAARLTSANLVKSEIRRRRREQEAYMQSTLDEPAETLWKEIAPFLDDAMGRLGETDRDAVVLRFFENKSATEIGTALRMNEETARRRVNRALDKLRRFFAKRGIASSAAAIAENISANSVQAVPISLAKAISAVAITKGATASVSTLTLVKGALKVMAWTKAKTIIVVGVGVVLVASVTPHVWYYHFSPDSWRHRFEAAYRLRHGEILRYIPPPFIPERLTYYRTQDPTQAKAIPAGPTDMEITQDKQGHLKWRGFGFGPKQFPLWLALRSEFGLKSYEYEGLQNLLNLPVNGDWTMCQGISQAELLKALEPILWKVTKHHILFEQRTVERDVIVVKGDHFAVEPGMAIQIYAENLHDNSYNHYGDLKALLDDIGARLEIRFIDETTLNSSASGNETSNLTWTLHQDSDAIAMKSRRTEMTDEVLTNLADQTGLTFTREQRPVPIWFVSEQQSSN